MNTRRPYITTKRHVYIPTEVDLELADCEVFELTEQMIRQQANLQHNYFLRGDTVVQEWDSFCGSHKWDESKNIRAATPLDRAAFALMKALEDWQRMVATKPTTLEGA